MTNNNEDEDKRTGEEEKGSRMDAAKAFFRAMYAGDEPSPATATQEPPVDSRRVQELEQLVKELEARTAEAEGLYKRMAADFDNFRRRTEREREEYQNTGVRKAADAFIPALDDLDRAIFYLTPETPANKIIESFQLVSQRIFTCLEGVGLKRLATKGEMFDPRFHEPVQQIETTEIPDGGIVNELRAGYMIGDKVVRPALVNVASNPTMSVPPMQELQSEGPPPKTSGETARPASVETPRPSTGETARPAEVNQEETPSAAEPAPPQPANQKEPKKEDGVFDLGDLGEF